MLPLQTKELLRTLGIIIPTPSIERQWEMICAIASNPGLQQEPVLITGETGTGKELVAKAIHTLGPKVRHPFVQTNAACLNNDLGASMIHGYSGRSYTGAKYGGEIGLFLQAGEGIIFLDELDSLSLGNQPLLLRAISERQVQPLGAGGRTTEIKARVIAASNADLPSMVEEGTFRQDLYQRFGFLEIKMPPLRDCVDAIESLLYYFLRMAGWKDDEGFPQELFLQILQYSWPGNIRELKNFATAWATVPMMRSQLKHRLQQRHLPAAITGVEQVAEAVVLSQSSELKLLTPGNELDEALRQFLLENPINGISEGLINGLIYRLAQIAITISNGNKQKAAAMLGIYRPRLYKILKSQGKAYERKRTGQSQ